MKRLHSTLLASLLMLPLITQAAQTPQGLVTDRRIKLVPYDADNVVQISTTFGFATTIELQKGEYITESPGIGKAAGWEIASKNYSNLIVIKPRVDNNTTNLNVTTNKGRTYTFLLTANANTARPTFRVRFVYAEKFGLGQESANQQEVLRLFDNPQMVNTRYSFVGDKSIAPIAARDNGKFTLLRFKPGAPIPAILAVDVQSRRESLVNYHLQAGFVVIEGVNAQYTLRFGEHITCVFNDKAIEALHNA